MANIRPSCPLPNTPMVELGRIDLFTRLRMMAKRYRRPIQLRRSGIYAAHSNSELNTADVCSSRNVFNAFRSSGRELAKMATANSAGFFAPASPIARVPTGTPAGI